jgi:hypothetical protein
MKGGVPSATARPGSLLPDAATTSVVEPTPHDGQNAAQNQYSIL